MKGMLIAFESEFNTNLQFRESFYSQGYILRNSESNNNNSNNDNNAESSASFKPVIKPKTAREIKAEMLGALLEEIKSSNVKTAKEGMDFIKKYVANSSDIKPDFKALALQGIDKEVEKLLKEVKPEVVSNANVSLQL